MTEAEWLACEDPNQMFGQFLDGETPWRKLILSACACLRNIWELIPEGSCRIAVEVWQGWVEEGIGTAQERNNAYALADEALDALYHQCENAPNPIHPKTLTEFYTIRAVYGLTRWGATHERGALDVAHHARHAVARVAWRDVARENDPATLKLAREAQKTAEQNEAGRQCDIIRDIFGNPFRPVALNPTCLAWNDGTVSRIAQAIYDERAFDRMPILADALEDAGCDNADILNHCRGDGPHVRGCWVVDLLLGKE
jgi:hypothetical protein